MQFIVFGILFVIYKKKEIKNLRKVKRLFRDKSVKHMFLN